MSNNFLSNEAHKPHKQNQHQQQSRAVKMAKPPRASLVTSDGLKQIHYTNSQQQQVENGRKIMINTSEMYQNEAQMDKVSSNGQGDNVSAQRQSRHTSNKDQYKLNAQFLSEQYEDEDKYITTTQQLDQNPNQIQQQLQQQTTWDSLESLFWVCIIMFQSIVISQAIDRVCYKRLIVSCEHKITSSIELFAQPTSNCCK